MKHAHLTIGTCDCNRPIVKVRGQMQFVCKLKVYDKF